LCPGDKNGIILPHFFDSVRDINSWALIDFEKSAALLREAMEGPANVSEVVLPPPWGATGFEPGLFRHSVLAIKKDRSAQNERALLEARLRGIYCQVDSRNIEKDFIDLAKK